MVAHFQRTFSRFGVWCWVSSVGWRVVGVVVTHFFAPTTIIIVTFLIFSVFYDHHPHHTVHCPLCRSQVYAVVRLKASPKNDPYSPVSGHSSNKRTLDAQVCLSEMHRYA